jgi:hypothetical protein
MRSPWGRLQSIWTGGDGSRWVLSDPSHGVFLTQGGVEGLGMPKFDLYKTSSPARPGSRYRGSRAQDRDAFWPLYVYSDSSSAEWRERDRAFWATMDPDVAGVWTIIDTEGRSRSLRCRFSESDDTFERDPFQFGWQLYGITLTAEEPFWFGEPQYRSVVAETPVDFFGAGAPPFHISVGNTLANASIDNPGENDAPLLYVLDGPWDSGASVGVGTDATVYGAAIATGKSVVIDTHPGLEGASLIDTPDAAAFPPGSQEWLDEVSRRYLVGTDVFTSLTSVALGVRVAPGESKPLAFTATGGGAIRTVLTPTYRRAW